MERNMWTHSSCSSSSSHSSLASFSFFLFWMKNKYLPSVGFGAEMWRMRKCWSVLWDGPRALKQVGWPRSLCTLPVFLCSFTLNLKTEKWNPLCVSAEAWLTARAEKVMSDTCALVHVYIMFSSSSEQKCEPCFRLCLGKDVLILFTV